MEFKGAVLVRPHGRVKAHILPPVEAFRGHDRAGLLGPSAGVRCVGQAVKQNIIIGNGSAGPWTR